MNWRLASVMFTLVFVVVTGILVTAALVTSYGGTTGVVLAIVAGFVVSMPVTYVVTGRLIEFSASQK